MAEIPNYENLPSRPIEENTDICDFHYFILVGTCPIHGLSVSLAEKRLGYQQVRSPVKGK